MAPFRVITSFQSSCEIVFYPKIFQECTQLHFVELIGTFKSLQNVDCAEVFLVILEEMIFALIIRPILGNIMILPPENGILLEEVLVFGVNLNTP